jgi:hypothetical protein
MADRWAASISIGGAIPLSLFVKEILPCMTWYFQVTDEIGNIVDESILQNAEDLTAYLFEKSNDADPRGGYPLTFSCDEVANGEFTDLEMVLQEHSIAYIRQSDPYYDYPHTVLICTPVSQRELIMVEGDPVILPNQIKEILKKSEQFAPIPYMELVSIKKELQDLLDGLQVPELEPFIIVPD